jgi:hypothetical protein
MLPAIVSARAAAGTTPNLRLALNQSRGGFLWAPAWPCCCLVIHTTTNVCLSRR